MFEGAAHVYDLLYEAAGRDYASEATAVHDQIQARNPAAGSLLDLACGTGAHLEHLRQWYDVVGMDLDAAMLDQARQRLPDVTLVEGDMRAFELGRQFEAVVCLFSAMGYGRSSQDLAGAVGCMAAHLAAGGVLIVDGWIRPEAWIDPGTADAVSAVGDGDAAARVSRSRRQGDITHLEMHHVVATSEGVKHLVGHHELKLFTVNEYEEAFRDAGLVVQRVDGPMADRDRYLAVKPA